MRVVEYLIFALAVCGQAHALEASAGADNVNTSQVGINAKIEAFNSITTASINDILNCQKQGKLYDPTSNVCIDVAEPLAQKIAACTTNKQFYNQNTGACVNSAPDLSAQLANTNDIVTRLVACYNVKGTFNTSTGVCTPASGGISKVVITTASTGTAHSNTKRSAYVAADYCSLSQAQYDFTGHAASCYVERSGNKWRVVATSNNSSCTANCKMVCYTNQ